MIIDFFFNNIKKIISPLFVLLVALSCNTYTKITKNDLVDVNNPDREAFGNFLWSRNKDGFIVIHKKI